MIENLSVILLFRGQCYNTFYIRNLQIFVLSYSIRTWKAFQAWFNKHSSLVWKFVNYGRKKYYNIGPRSQCNKTLFSLLLMLRVKS